MVSDLDWLAQRHAGRGELQRHVWDLASRLEVLLRERGMPLDRSDAQLFERATELTGWRRRE